MCVLSACPPGFALYDGWCYNVQGLRFTQPEGRQRCQAAGHWLEPGDLADIRNAEENHFVFNLHRK